MFCAQTFVKTIDSDLTKALREREDGGEQFVAQTHPYYRWERETTRSLEGFRRILHNSERYSPHLARIPGLEERLRETAASVSERIRQDAPARKEVEAAHAVRVERQIAMRARERALSRSRGPSLSMSMDIGM